MIVKYTVLLVAAEFLLHTASVDGTCDARAGPAGTLECVDLQGYVGKQWATCLTDAYIKQVSKNKHFCEDRSRTYCYYQCMMEIHNIRYATVTADCSCDDRGGNPTTIVPSQPVSTLDPLCFSPSGESCSWYRNCLERKIPCTGGVDGYAIEYAEKFCNRFEQFRYRLSQQGQAWMEATRKCLQVSMVPSLRPFSSQTCDTVKKMAFEAHPTCYLNPFPGAPSICNLSVLDRLHIFWIIRTAFATDFKETLLGLNRVSSQCDGRMWQTAEYGTTVLIRIYFYLFGRSKRSVSALPSDVHTRLDAEMLANNRMRRQTENVTQVGESEEELRDHMLAADLWSAVAQRLGWADKDLMWFAYGQRGANSSVQECYVMFADKRSYGLQNATEDSPAINMTSLLNATAQAFRDGVLNGITLQGQRVQLVTFSTCQDDACNSTTLTVDAPPEVVATPSTPVSGCDLTQASVPLFLAILSSLFTRLVQRL